MAEKAATLGELQELHKMVARSLNQRIQQDIEDCLPTDAATLGVAIKFLKDNAVTADPADSDDLKGLRDRLTEQAKARRERGNNVVELAKADLKVMQA